MTYYAPYPMALMPYLPSPMPAMMYYPPCPQSIILPVAWADPLVVELTDRPLPPRGAPTTVPRTLRR